MKIKLLIATDDTDYAEHLSAELSARHSGVVDATVCSTPERLSEALATRKFDAALLEASMVGSADISAITLPLLLQTAEESYGGDCAELKGTKKYQRITSIVSDVLEQSAKVSAVRCADPRRARITAVWSPAGGAGKTTVALAYAARKASEGKQVHYLNLESFSSVPVYFEEDGKSISALFEKLEYNEGSAQMLVKSIERRDSGGISYFCRPANYDDMNVLSAENITGLLNACSGMTDELVVDLSCTCDERTSRVLDAADRVFLVTDPTNTTRTKVSQFMSQHRVFGCIKEKVVFVENKSAASGKPAPESLIRLPPLRTTDLPMVYKTLSASF